MTMLRSRDGDLDLMDSDYLEDTAFLGGMEIGYVGRGSKGWEQGSWGAAKKGAGGRGAGENFGVGA
jgi:hypothetical protein